MFGFGMPEMIILLVIILVVFGAGKIPELGGAMGKSIRNFKRATEGKEDILINPTPGKDYPQESDVKAGDDAGGIRK
jgi:sec-independent protein translocase protein TatA